VVEDNLKALNLTPPEHRYAAAAAARDIKMSLNIVDVRGNRDSVYYTSAIITAENPV
jgi:hypothetical protein